MSMTNELAQEVGVDNNGEINTDRFNEMNVYSRRVVPELTAAQKMMILEM